MASFRSTLAETVEADLLLHMVDAADPEFPAQLAEVERVLDDLGAGGRPRLLVFNKIDRVTGDEDVMGLAVRYPGSLTASARTGEGLDGLRARLVAEAASKRNEAA